MASRAVAQGQEVSYELHTLGWKAFQDLCLTITSELLGQTVQAFLPSKDGGRDGAFYGPLARTGESGTDGSFTVQCKFTGKRDRTLSLPRLGDELAKAEKLASRGLATRYILMTNYQVSGVLEERVRAAFLAIPGIDAFYLFGAEWITLKIRESARLRMLVPRVYGLGDLSQILDERAYRQAQQILHAMGSDLDKFVITDAYRKSAKALTDPGFVLLLGEPASGKSTIAASLALGAIDAFSCSTLKIRNAEEFVKHWNTDDPKQFFWVDDAFGATQYQRDLALEWTRAFRHMNAALKKRAKIIFTARDYIYRAACADLKTSEFPLIEDSQVIIRVQELTLVEKSQILYNHIKRGDQTKTFRSSIKTFLPAVAESKNFLPEIARRLGNSLFTKKLRLGAEEMRSFVEEPVPFLAEVLKGLDTKCFAALALVFLNDGTLQSPIMPTSLEMGALSRLGATQADVQVSLTAMDDSLVKLVKGDEPRWTFKHPTIRDALASLIAADPERMDIYLQGCPLERLLNEVTCGDVGLEGVKVVIPKSRYEAFAQRLRAHGRKWPKHLFLAYRCDRTFLVLYVESDETVLQDACHSETYELAPLDLHPAARILTRLHEYGLLPSIYRQEFLEEVTRRAIEVPDTAFLTTPSIRKALSEDEITDILAGVKDEFLPSLDDVVEGWRDQYPADGDPSGHFGPLLLALNTYRDALTGDAGAEKAIGKAVEAIEEAIDDLAHDDESAADGAEDYSRLQGPELLSEERSIFDDIDDGP